MNNHWNLSESDKTKPDMGLKHGTVPILVIGILIIGFLILLGVRSPKKSSTEPIPTKSTGFNPDGFRLHDLK